jgi:hypothetical protein
MSNSVVEYVHHPLTKRIVSAPPREREFNTTKAYTQRIFSEMAKLLGRKLFDNERIMVVGQLREFKDPKGGLKNKTFTERVQFLSNILVAAIKDGACGTEANDIDIYELQKAVAGLSNESKESLEAMGINVGVNVKIPDGSSVNLTGIFGKNNSSELLKMFNPQALYNEEKILLDTRYRTLSGDGTQSFNWTYTAYPTTNQGTTNSLEEIRNIKAMRLGPFRIPKTASADKHHNRLTIFVEEYSTQSVVAHENRRYHWMAEPTVNGSWIEVDPTKYDDGWYEFNNVVTKLEELTLSFGSPLQKVIFPTDRMSGTITYSNPAILTTAQPHTLINGSNVIIETFNTNSSINDANAISLVNAVAGNTIDELSDTTFALQGVNLRSVRNTIAGTVAVTNGSGAMTGTLTEFSTDLTTGDRVLITDALGNDYIHTVTVTDDTNAVIAPVYAGATTTGLFILRATNGTVAVVNNTAVVTGTATTFTTEYKVGDNITIIDSGGVGRNYGIDTITSNLLMTLSSVYLGATEGGLVTYKDNAIDNYSVVCYFNDLRMFIPLTFRVMYEST